MQALSSFLQAGLANIWAKLDEAKREQESCKQVLVAAKAKDAGVQQLAGTSDASSNSVANTQGMEGDAASPPQHDTRASAQKRTRESPADPSLLTPDRRASKRRAIAPLS